MRMLVSGIALVVLAGCATAAPKPEWRLVDGAWVGPSTTYQDGSAPSRPCVDGGWCRVLDSLVGTHEGAKALSESLGKIK